MVRSAHADWEISRDYISKKAKRKAKNDKLNDIFQPIKVTNL